jgi:nucleoid-associated protein YgaU
VAADEPEISQVQSGAGDTDAGNEERWQTYLHYDLAVQQAVRRLSALSNENVEAFRTLLLKGRDRTRIKDYEAESIRGLQGEAFVGDEELQRTLIVLNAEDPRLGEEFKKLVARTGRPENLDQAVASLRAPAETAATPKTAKVVPITALREAAPQSSPPAEAFAGPETAKAATMAPPLEAEPAPLRATETDPPGSKRVVLAAAVVGIAVIGFAAFQFIPHGVLPASTLAAPTERVAASAPAAPSAPAVVPAQDPATAPAQDNETKSSQTALRPADNEPERLAEPEKLPESTDGSSAEHPMSKPAPGSYYRAVRGDMLTRIALAVYNDPFKYVVIQKANPMLRDTPNLVLVNQVIYIPPR